MKFKSNLHGRDVYVIDGNRTPFLKAKGRGAFSAADLALQASRPLLLRQNFDPSDLDEVITGCVMPSPDEANISRIIALRLGCGHKVPAWTVQRNCASGLQAIDNAAHNISSGRADLVLAGGTEAMSHAPLLFPNKMVDWFVKWGSARNFGSKFKTLLGLRLSFFMPVIALLRGLHDPVVNLSMGQTAENLAYKFGITREEMDEFACLSHNLAHKAFSENRLNEITPIIDNKGKVYKHDSGVRADSSIDGLAKLKPFFDRKYGAVTAGNSSQITDGAAYLLLASKDAVKKYKLKPLAKIVDLDWQALDPAQMGLGPVHASAAIMQRHNLNMQDIDAWEINEAFAAQVLACVKAFNDQDYCKSQLGLDKALGELKLDTLNTDGGAIALGHPVGASGARITLHMINKLKAENKQKGMSSICIGGGQGGAILIENYQDDGDEK